MFLFNGKSNTGATILLAHGAGAPMDSRAMNDIAESLADSGLRVARFEFDYMASRRRTGSAKPPPKAETLQPEYVKAIADLEAEGPLIIGGKSMGGRVASMIADEQFSAKRICGVLCLGYPFHPVGKPDVLRTAHLAGLQCPALIVQGTRDPFGTYEEVRQYKLSPSIEVDWLEDGDHDLRPRKKISGFSSADHMRAMAEKVADWSKKLAT